MLLYTLILFGVTLLPLATLMSGARYLGVAVALGLQFIRYAWRLYRDYSDALARRTFRFSIAYLFGLFGALRSAVDAKRIAGIALMIAGVYLARKTG